MKETIEREEPRFAKLLSSVDEDLGRDRDSLVLFEWVVEEHYEEEIKENQEIFKNRPDLVAIYNENILHELDVMLDYFVTKEEYEKCSKLLEVKEYISNKIADL